MDLGKLFEDNQALTSEGNPVNNLRDHRKIQVIICTTAKTGTTSLGLSFQNCIDGTFQYKNVVHCHSEQCWYQFHPYLLEHGFKISDLIDYCNSNGINPLVVQSYREPFSRFLSTFFEINRYRQDDLTIDDYLLFLIRCTIYREHIFHHLYERMFEIDYTDKIFDYDAGFAYVLEDKFSVLHTRIDKLNQLSNNIKYIPELRPYHSIEIKPFNMNGHPKYQELKDQIKYPRIIYDKILENESDIMSFYYSPEEIEQIKISISDKIDDTFDFDNFFSQHVPEDFCPDQYLEQNPTITESTDPEIRKITAYLHKITSMN